MEIVKIYTTVLLKYSKGVLNYIILKTGTYQNV